MLHPNTMACKSCTSGGCGSNLLTDGQTAGCQNNGACGTGGCNKMNVFDWLSHMDVPTLERFDVVEVKFKGGRKEYFRNSSKLELYTGDSVIVDVPNGHNLGFVSLQGELVRLQLLKKNIANNDDLRPIYRKATEKDLEKHQIAIARDHGAIFRSRQLVDDYKLNMKLSDVEFQSDNSKAIFYYSSDERVDFRELIKILAAEFKIRVEMKQISLRQEAARIGGIGICGRELCCSTWLTDFKNVNTSAARYQNLSLNPVKLSGQCGRLKCCLNYELDTYMDALKDIPTIDERITTARGQATLQKTDIFRKLMWFSFEKDDNWYSVPVQRVVEIMELNKKGIFPATFEDLREQKEVDQEAATHTPNSDLALLDKKYSKNKKKKKPNPTGQPDRPPRDPASGPTARNEFRPLQPRPEAGNMQNSSRPQRPPRPNNPQNQQPRPPRPENADRPNGSKPAEPNANPADTPRPNNKKKRFKPRPPRPE
jgi:cell fate regulator YaaT (PSP1 superfamily)